MAAIAKSPRLLSVFAGHGIGVAVIRDIAQTLEEERSNTAARMHLLLVDSDLLKLLARKFAR